MLLDPFAVFADIDQNELLSRIQAPLISRKSPRDAGFRVLNDLEEAWGVLPWCGSLFKATSD